MNNCSKCKHKLGINMECECCFLQGRHYHLLSTSDIQYYNPTNIPLNNTPVLFGNELYWIYVNDNHGDGENLCSKRCNICMKFNMKHKNKYSEGLYSNKHFHLCNPYQNKDLKRILFEVLKATENQCKKKMTHCSM